MISKVEQRVCERDIHPIGPESPLSTGTELGVYEIIAPWVPLARTRCKKRTTHACSDVAISVSAAQFSERFERDHAS